MIEDSFKRPLRDLRISVTDRCNFRCTYCMPTEDMTWFARGDILSLEEIIRLVGLLTPHGVHRVRLTGGEPMLTVHRWALIENISPLSRQL